MAMASPSKSTTGSPTASDSALSCQGGIEALKMKVGPVRRNLFGPLDHQQLQQDFQRLLCMSMEMANKRWNFNFQADVPGEGSNIEWEELKCQDVPAFYHSCMIRPVVGPGAEAKKGMKRTLSSSPTSSSSSGSGDEYLELSTKRCCRGKRRQSAITDFFKVKKSRLLHYKSSSRL
ncbi:cyclin-dependent kinase inhibitor 1D [Platichthys flesus]|uniref:cyclin-dependent kinase inhibitor 1D n=1 Tax=Platichthys flesus TaxID=8260 RepID=UPI001A8B53B9|nr:cyclin-dependent kinase inhibitor 1D [Platichthys flesus]